VDLHNTVLKDRVLWYDGDSSFDPNSLLSIIQQYNDIRYVDNITKEVIEYNRFVSPAQLLTIKDTCNPLSLDWNLPEEYSNLNVVDWVLTKHEEFAKDFSLLETTNRENRLITELKKYKKLSLFPVLRAVIYIINTLNTHNIVWGIGRGSSTASYVLFVIGTHDVDSYLYDLDITDFLH